MIDHTRTITSAEVYSVIWARHSHALTVFTAYSAPDGDPYGDPSQCEMMTEWGFKDAACPIIGHRKSWVKDSDEATTFEYWLCVPEEGES